MHGAHHPKADIDRLYLKRAAGGRGLIGAEDCIRIERENLISYIRSSEEQLLKAVHKEGILKSGKGEKTKEEIQQEHTEKRSQKAIHGQFEGAIKEIKGNRSWDWMKSGKLKKETESLIVAAQDQAIATNNMRRVVFGEDVSPLCRMCGKANETVAHIVSECSKLAQNEYKNWRHDQVARIIHWKLCEKWGFEKADRWYEHKPERVMESEICKILWDFPIQTDKKLEHNRPDIVVIDKTERTCLIIDPSCPFDLRVAKKEDEKLTNYNPLQYEIARIWKMKKVTIVPVIIGALGTVTENIDSWITKMGIVCSVELLQRGCLLGTARILRKVLNI